MADTPKQPILVDDEDHIRDLRATSLRFEEFDVDAAFTMSLSLIDRHTGG